MLPEEVLAVIISIRRPNRCVNMILCGFSIPAQRDGALMVEFDQYHGTVNPVVKNGVGIHPSDPCKVSLIEVRFDFFHLHLCRSLFQIVNPERGQSEKGSLLIRIELSD